MRVFTTVDRRTVARSAAAALAMAAALAPHVAAQDASAVIEYRRTAMQLIAGHQNAIEALLEETVTPGGHIVPHARALLDLSIMMPDLFPAGSGGEDTRARDEIWQDAAGFSAAVTEFRTAAEGLLRAAESGDKERVREGLGVLSQGCGTCHQPFRTPVPGGGPPAGR